MAGSPVASDNAFSNQSIANRSAALDRSQRSHGTKMTQLYNLIKPQLLGLLQPSNRVSATPSACLGLLNVV